MKVPLLDLKSEYVGLRDEILPALDRTCQNSTFVEGPEVQAFEREFADFCGTAYCVALSSGTAALHLGLLALGLGTLQVVLDKEGKVQKVGQPVHGRVAEPVYAFDKLVVPVGTEVTGRITQLETVAGEKRTSDALNADFTPPHAAKA